MGLNFELGPPKERDSKIRGFEKYKVVFADSDGKREGFKKMIFIRIHLLLYHTVLGMLTINHETK